MGMVLVFIGLIIAGIFVRYAIMNIEMVMALVPWKAIFIIFGIILLLKYVL